VCWTATSVRCCPDKLSSVLDCHLSKMLSKQTIKCVGLPPKKTSNLLRQVQDDFGMKTPGIYTIHCKCEVYIGQTSRSIETRIKGHRPYRWHNQKNRQQWNTAALRIMLCYYMIPKYRLPNLAKWTLLLWKQSN